MGFSNGRLLIAVTLFILILAGCQSGSTTVPVTGGDVPAGRIAGSITINGALPVTSYVSLTAESNLDLVVHPAGDTSLAAIVAVFDLPELGQHLLENQECVLDFQFDGLPVGEYQLGLVYRGVETSADDYTRYWLSSLYILNAAQKSIPGLILNVDCFNNAPTGFVSGHNPLDGYLITGNRLVVLTSSESPNYLFKARVDDWNRMVFNSIRVPCGNRYNVRLSGLDSTFLEPADSQYGSINNYHIDIISEKTSMLDCINADVSDPGNSGNTSCRIIGEVSLSGLSKLDREFHRYCVVLESANQVESSVKHICYLRDSTGTELGYQGYSFGNLKSGKYILSVYQVENIGDGFSCLYTLPNELDVHESDNYYEITPDRINIGMHRNLAVNMDMYGPIPANEDLVIGLFEYEQLGHSQRIQELPFYTEISLNEPEDADGKHRFIHQFLDVKPGVYQICLFTYDSQDWGIEDYDKYWVSEPIWVRDDQYGDMNVDFALDCFNTPPLGSLTCSLYFNGNIQDEGYQRILVTSMSEYFYRDFFMQVDHDQWGLVKLDRLPFPSGEFQLRLKNLGDLIEVGVNQDYDLGSKYIGISGSDREPDTTIIDGSIVIGGALDPAMDYVVVAEAVSPQYGTFTRAVYHLSELTEVDPGVHVFSLKYLREGVYDVFAVTVEKVTGESEEIARLDGNTTITEDDVTEFHLKHVDLEVE